MTRWNDTVNMETTDDITQRREQLEADVLAYIEDRAWVSTGSLMVHFACVGLLDALEHLEATGYLIKRLDLWMAV